MWCLCRHRSSTSRMWAGEELLTIKHGRSCSAISHLRFHHTICLRLQSDRSFTNQKLQQTWGQLALQVYLTSLYNVLDLTCLSFFFFSSAFDKILYINPLYEESIETVSLLTCFLEDWVNKIRWSVEAGLAVWNHTQQLSVALHTFRPAGSSCQETADDCSDNQPSCGGVTRCQDGLKCCHDVATRTQASCYRQVGTVLLQACRWPWLSRAIRRGTQEHGKP